MREEKEVERERERKRNVERVEERSCKRMTDLSG